MTMWLGATLLAIPVACLGFAYFVYPVLLLVAARRRPEITWSEPVEWPEVTLVVPVYNEETAIARTLEALLALDYPADRRHILVMSDASSDRTDAIVGEYAARGVRLVRLAARGGKTAAENEAGRWLRGTLVVNTDATIHIPPDALKPLVAAFEDPTVGVASGRDLSVGDVVAEANRGESGYVGYEMWVRSLETRVGTIVGASGCFYAIRRHLFDEIFPEALSRDFASPLIAREHGFRSVSVREAVAWVPRTRSLRAEYRRKVRTMTRGLETLWYKRHLMNPFRYGAFAWMLLGHKLLRWLVFLVAPLALPGLMVLAWYSSLGQVLLLGAFAAGLAAALAFVREGRGRVPRAAAMAGFILGSFAAGFVAWMRALKGELNPVWEPTRRPAASG